MCGEQGSCAREIAGKEKTPEPVLPSRLTLQKFRPQGVTRASGGGEALKSRGRGGRTCPSDGRVCPRKHEPLW